MLPPLGLIFGLLVTFDAAQVWSDMDRAHAAVVHEASALRTVVLLAASFPGEPEARLRALVCRHIDDAVTREWPNMARKEATLEQIPVALADALHFTLTLTPRGAGQMVAQREIVASLKEAFEARRQRFLLSRSGVNWIKWAALLMVALCTLLAVSMVHSENRATAAIAMTIFATAVAVCVVLISSHHPFRGEFSVGPGVLLQVKPEGNAYQPSGPKEVTGSQTASVRARLSCRTARPGSRGRRGGLPRRPGTGGSGGADPGTDRGPAPADETFAPSQAALVAPGTDRRLRGA
jgi:hypothetical protein